MVVLVSFIFDNFNSPESAGFKKGLVATEGKQENGSY